MGTLERDAFPFIDDCPVDAVTPPMVIEIAKNIEKRGALEIARQLLQRMNAVFRYAVQTGKATYNPAADMQGVLKSRKVVHQAALSSDELPEFMQALMHLYKGGTQGQMYWYHLNQKGDVVGSTKQNGNSHHNYRYDAYGAVLPENGNFTDPHNHYTLTGKEFDENTGLVWFGARHYEPETGVWMGQDVYRGRLDEQMSLHRFWYVNNNPVNGWDWYGFVKVLGIHSNVYMDANLVIPNQ